MQKHVATDGSGPVCKMPLNDVKPCLEYYPNDIVDRPISDNPNFKSQSLEEPEPKRQCKESSENHTDEIMRQNSSTLKHSEIDKIRDHKSVEGHPIDEESDISGVDQSDDGSNDNQEMVNGLEDSKLLNEIENDSSKQDKRKRDSAPNPQTPPQFSPSLRSRASLTSLGDLDAFDSSGSLIWKPQPGDVVWGEVPNCMGKGVGIVSFE